VARPDKNKTALHQIAALNEALTLAVSLLRVAVGAVRSKRTGQPFREGKRNGNYRHGGRTNEMIEVWKLIKSLR
jgi:hypothetical protein